MLLLILATFAQRGWASDNLPAPVVLDAKEGVVACYWETYLYPKFTSQEIEANLCNHILYGTAKLDKTTWELTHDNITIDIGQSGFRNMSEMKTQNPRLKVEIGAWSQQGGAWQTPKEYFEMASDAAKRETFVKSVVTFVTKNNFDGFHLHWGNPKSPEIDHDEAKAKLTLLLRELSTALHLVDKTLSLAIWSPLTSKIDKRFEIGKIYKVVDLVFVNAFHYFGNWFQKTGGFAPLYPGKGEEVPDEKYLNVDHSWQHMKRRKAIPCKTVLVVAPKGCGFTLKNATENGMGSPSIRSAIPTIGAEPKFNEICEIVQPRGEWVRVWDEERKVSYMHKGEEWVSYEDEQSVEAKVNYVNVEGLAGLAINNLAYDDFAGRCNSSSRFPLVRLVKEKLGTGRGCTGSASSTRFDLALLLLLLPALTIFNV